MKSSKTAVFVSATLIASCGGAVPESSPKTPEQPREYRAVPTPDAASLQADGAADAESTESESSDPSSAPESRGGDEEARESMVGALDARFDDFGKALATGAPNCDEADGFRREVCRLAERICDLSRDLPPSSTSHSDCEDGKERCEAANRRYSDVCG
jgi:hypothetical protein